MSDKKLLKALEKLFNDNTTLHKTVEVHYYVDCFEAGIHYDGNDPEPKVTIDILDNSDKTAWDTICALALQEYKDER